MSNFNSVEKIYEFTNRDSNSTCGVYLVDFKGKQRVFIRNGDSVGTVSHYVGEPVAQCVGEIRDDVKKEFFEMIECQ